MSGPGASNAVLSSVKFFELKIPGVSEIGRFMECSGLELSFEIYEYAEGGNNLMVHHFPGRLRYPNLVLTRGMTNETALFDWFKKTRTQPERKEVVLSLLKHGTSTPIRTWTFAEAFPVRWVGPTFHAGNTTAAMETLEIAHGGLQGL